jgi:hypothetical protein
MLYSRQARASRESSIQKQLTSAPAPKLPADQTKPGDVIPVDSSKNVDDIKKIIEQKVQEQQAGATPTPAAVTPAASATPVPSGTVKPKAGL